MSRAASDTLALVPVAAPRLSYDARLAEMLGAPSATELGTSPAFQLAREIADAADAVHRATGRRPTRADVGEGICERLTAPQLCMLTALLWCDGITIHRARGTTSARITAARLDWLLLEAV